MRTRHSTWICLFCFSCPALAHESAQTGRSEPLASVPATLNHRVTLDFVVADKAEHAVPGLQQQDLRLLDNKEPQNDLRSKIVHGSASRLNAKLQNRLQMVHSLREILRRTILSVMAIFVDGNSMEVRLDELLDRIVFDEPRRKEIQTLAAKFLHLEGISSASLH